jgi:hypothetical protein
MATEAKNLERSRDYQQTPPQLAVAVRSSLSTATASRCRYNEGGS